MNNQFILLYKSHNNNYYFSLFIKHYDSYQRHSTDHHGENTGNTDTTAIQLNLIMKREKKAESI
jgi:hypothetical protein